MLNRKARSASPKSNVYGFITDWNAVILGGDGRTLRDNVPGTDGSSDIAYGDLDRKGASLRNVFDESDVRGFYDAKGNDAKASALGRVFGACAIVPDGFVVGNDVATVTRCAGEWSTRSSRLVPADVPGTDLRLNDRSREILTMVAHEGHPHMDWAVYYQALMEYLWGHKFSYPDDYLHDGFVDNSRAMADGDPDFIGEFVEFNVDDIRYFDCPIARDIVKTVL